MEPFKKIVQRQDAHFKLTQSTSNETSINLSRDISDYLSDTSGAINFTLYREDFIKAIGVVSNILPLYNRENKVESSNEVFDFLYKEVSSFFNQNKTARYTVQHLKRDDNRFYLNNLGVPGFNLRHFLVERHTIMLFGEKIEDSVELRLLTTIQPADEELALDDVSIDTVRDRFIQYLKRTNSHMGNHADYVSKFEKDLGDILSRYYEKEVSIFSFIDIDLLKNTLSEIRKTDQVLDAIVGEYQGTKYAAYTVLNQYFSFLETLKDCKDILKHHITDAEIYVSNSKGVNENIDNKYRPFITAIKSKPFLLLAGISGTGKSRIVRELARSCWSADSDEFKAQKPSNFEMVQVKPNWHDSSELIGYVSRIDGIHYIVGPFLKFMVKAIKNPTMPYFLCLDEMNLAPVEQYFAEYLSVIESRKVDENGNIKTDPIIDYSSTEEYKSLIDQLFLEDEVRESYLTEEGGKRLYIPNNLIVVGTVNMDETTFSFSRKVLDRAMTIEMNEVNLDGGLSSKYEVIGKLGKDDLIGTAVEGVDVYEQNKEVCDQVINYLQKVNDELEGTPFKVAYRTRNEFLLYVINNLPYRKLDDGTELNQNYVIARALDEITSMKILSRIEGDESKVKKSLLEGLKKGIKAQLGSISEKDVFVAKAEGETTEDGKTIRQSISLAKLDEMIDRLDSGYTSFWA